MFVLPGSRWIWAGSRTHPSPCRRPRPGPPPSIVRCRPRARPPPPSVDPSTHQRGPSSPRSLTAATTAAWPDLSTPSTTGWVKAPPTHIWLCHAVSCDSTYRFCSIHTGPGLPAGWAVGNPMMSSPGSVSPFTIVCVYKLQFDLIYCLRAVFGLLCVSDLALYAKSDSKPSVSLTSHHDSSSFF